MSDNSNNYGKITWIDLTVTSAEKVRDFYSAVAGWEPRPVSMEDYDDYEMLPAGHEEPVAGICHARGVNVDLPSQWLIYITVEDADEAAAKVMELGGRVLVGPKNMGPRARYCVIQDPGGAVAALYSDRK